MRMFFKNKLRPQEKIPMRREKLLSILGAVYLKKKKEKRTTLPFYIEK